MKNLKKIQGKARRLSAYPALFTALAAAMALAAALALTACDLNGEDGDGGSKNTDTSGNPLTKEDGTLTGDAWTSHTTDYSILVRNNTGEKLVAFKGDLEAGKLIGGIPAHAQNHGLPMNTALFPETTDFPMILLTEAQYNANRSNLSSQKNTPFTRVYVFYNKNGDNTVHYEIAAGLGGDNSLVIENPAQNINVEIRIGGVAGETLGYAPKGMLETTLKLENGDYNIFPVFKRYNKTRDVLETVYPKNQQNKPWFQMITFDGSNTNPQRLRLGSLLKNLTLTSGAAWVVVDNQTTSGAIRFYEGSVPRITPAGHQGISNSAPITFQVDMTKVEENYSDSREFSNWTFGPADNDVPLQESATDTTPKNTVTIERDKMYTITVKGDINASGLHAYISDERLIDTSAFKW